MKDASSEIKYSANACECKSYIKNLYFLVVLKINSDLNPSRKMNVNIQEFINIKIYDTKFNISKHVDIILDAGVFYKF